MVNSQAFTSEMGKREVTAASIQPNHQRFSLILLKQMKNQNHKAKKKKRAKLKNQKVKVMMKKPKSEKIKNIDNSHTNK